MPPAAPTRRRLIAGLAALPWIGRARAAGGGAAAAAGGPAAATAAFAAAKAASICAGLAWRYRPGCSAVKARCRMRRSRRAWSADSGAAVPAAAPPAAAEAPSAAARARRCR